VSERWKNCIAIGKQLSGTRFISFKTPLDDEYFTHHLPPNLAPFTPNLLVDEVKRQNFSLGLLIDLIKGKNYYNERSLTNFGIEYKKIYICGCKLSDARLVREF
ncbi:hypothetical protein HELRODRAFT_146638, partial [Helobdella robusta]|uniref:Uncharacterized protein n=1 Tax=Helobdella robusta TaxID=6412 RepID=T1EJT5_HELRO